MKTNGVVLVILSVLLGLFTGITILENDNTKLRAVVGQLLLADSQLKTADAELKKNAEMLLEACSEQELAIK